MRLFIAIDFKELKEYLQKLQNDIDESLAKLKKVGTFHLTLKFLGKVPEEKVEGIKEKLKQVKLSPFPLTLDKIGTFPSESYIRVIWVSAEPPEEVTKLQESIENSLKEFNLKKDFKFHPHITLARVKFVNDKEKFIKNLKDIKVEETSKRSFEGFENKFSKKTIEVKDFRLVKSTLTPKGPVYEDLAIYS